MTRKPTKDWFAVDREGLALQATERGPARVLLELVSNAFDEDDCTTLTIDIDRREPLEGPGSDYVDLRVVDDSPAGFRNLADAFTLFARSYKRDDVEKRGQFNLGEKWFLALCRDASLHTTTGHVSWTIKGGRIVDTANRRDAGTVIEARYVMTAADLSEFESLLDLCLAPDGMTMLYNGTKIAPRNELATGRHYLPTLAPDSNGVMRSVTRKAPVSLYPATNDETPMVMELGIPIVETEGRWHINIAQRIPLNRDRDNVTPSFRRHLVMALAEIAVRTGLLREEDASHPWVTTALNNRHLAPEAVEGIITARYGHNRVIADPSDTEATVKAAAEGHAVIHGGAMSKAAWDNVRRHGVAEAAGATKFATRTPLAGSENAPAAEFYTEAELSKDMIEFAAVVKRISEAAVDCKVTLLFLKSFGQNDHSACYSKGGTMIVNARLLGRAWFAPSNRIAHCDLIVHELAHELVSSHHEREPHGYFYDACTKIAGHVIAAEIDRSRQIEVDADLTDETWQ
jgi:hypothetical protein